MKRIGGKLYLHESVLKFLSKDLYEEVEKALKSAYTTIGSFNWNCIRIKPDGFVGAMEIAFQYSPDFDSADEPEVIQTVRCLWMCNNEWEVKSIKAHTNTIWHHKWMWVNPDYKGFDYEASKARSALWKPFVKKEELTKIGNKIYWESIKPRWEKTP